MSFLWFVAVDHLALLVLRGMKILLVGKLVVAWCGIIVMEILVAVVGGCLVRVFIAWKGVRAKAGELLVWVWWVF